MVSSNKWNTSWKQQRALRLEQNVKIRELMLLDACSWRKRQKPDFSQSEVFSKFKRYAKNIHWTSPNVCTWRNPRKSETEQLKKWKQQARMSSRTKCQKRDWLKLLDGCPWWNGSRRNSNLWGEGNKNWIRHTIYIFLFSKIIQKLPPHSWSGAWKCAPRRSPR